MPTKTGIEGLNYANVSRYGMSARNPDALHYFHFHMMSPDFTNGQMTDIGDALFKRMDVNTLNRVQKKAMATQLVADLKLINIDVIMLNVHDNNYSQIVEVRGNVVR